MIESKKEFSINIKKDDLMPIWKFFSFSFMFFMMITNLVYSAPWGDEWVEYYYSKKTLLDGTMYRFIVTTFQPPLYNWLMHFWLKVNDSILWFRSFNILIGVIAGIFLFKSLRLLYNEWIAAGTVIVLSCIYEWIYCIQECSEYALMLTFIFGLFYFYINTNANGKFKYEIGMTLMAIGAMYSQYGAFFIVVPVLLLYWLRVVFSKNLKRIIKITAVYFVSLILFAVPLWIFFARIQFANKIDSADNVTLSIRLFKDFPTKIGEMIAYLTCLRSDNMLLLTSKGLGITLLAFAVLLLLARFRVEWIKRSLIASFLITYFIHYVAVKMNLYAYSGNSDGFLQRYSYFYIPLLCLVTPILLLEILSITKIRYRNALLGIIGGGIFVFIGISFPKIMANWDKAYGDKISQAWMSNHAYESVTYLIGTANLEHEFYILDSIGDYDVYKNVTWQYDKDNLPDDFWIWYASWGEASYNALIEDAEEQGYMISNIVDYSYAGRLTHCEKTSERRTQNESIQ